MDHMNNGGHLERNPSVDGTSRRSIVFHIPHGAQTEGSPGLLPFLGSVRARGVEIEIVVTAEELLHNVQNMPEAVVALSAQEQTIHYIARMAREVRRKCPDSWIVVGGPLVEHYPVELLNAGVDIVITGEADIVFPLVLKVLPQRRLSQQGLPYSCVERIAEAVHGRIRPYLGAAAPGRIYLQDSQGIIQAIEGRFLPSEKELRDLWVYPWDLYRSREWTTLNLHTQRGCTWNRCSFCTSPKVPMRRITPGQVIEVVTQALNEPVRTLAFSDDTFLQDGEWTTKVLEELRAMDLRGRITLFGQVRVTEELEPMLPLLAEAGFVRLELGVETLLPARARLLCKSNRHEEYCELARQLVGKVASAGIIPQVNIILTDPSSTPDSLTEEIKRLCELVDYTHSCTGIAPTFNFNLTTRPSRGSRLSRRYPFTICTDSGMSAPDEFILSEDMVRILTAMAERTSSGTRFAASFEILEVFLDCLEEFLSADKETSATLGEALSYSRNCCRRVRQRFERQFKLFMLQRVESPRPQPPDFEHDCRLPAEIVAVKDWLSGYPEGIDLFAGMAQEVMDG